MLIINIKIYFTLYNVKYLDGTIDNTLLVITCYTILWVVCSCDKEVSSR